MSWQSLWKAAYADIRGSVTKPLIAPEAITVLKLLELFKETGVHIALITDEYGSIQGIITLHDIMEAIVGDVHSLGEPVEMQIVVREDGSWLVDGDTPVEKLKDSLICGFLSRGRKRILSDCCWNDHVHLAENP